MTTTGNGAGDPERVSARVIELLAAWRPRAGERGACVAVSLPAVVVLRPKDTVGETDRVIRDHLAGGASMVWELDPHFRVVTVIRNDRPPEGFNLDHHMPEYPEMPGFAPAVAELFE